MRCHKHAYTPAMTNRSANTLFYSSSSSPLPCVTNKQTQEEGSTAKESGRVGTGSEGGSSGGGGGSGSKGHKKRAWVAAEDGLMKQLVETHGPKDWNYISGQLQGRSAKQCCER